jgi:hypothetical protein
MGCSRARNARQGRRSGGCEVRNGGSWRGERAARLRRRGGGRASSPLDQPHDGVALLGVDAAQLVLDVHASLAAGIEQIFALNAQLTRKLVDADFLFRIFLQAELPVCLANLPIQPFRLRLALPFPYSNRAAHPGKRFLSDGGKTCTTRSRAEALLEGLKPLAGLAGLRFPGLKTWANRRCGSRDGLATLRRSVVLGGTLLRSVAKLSNLGRPLPARKRPS